MLRTIICKGCGVQFLQKHWAQLYCSTDCPRTKNIQGMENIPPEEETCKTLCTRCGKDFNAQSGYQRYCSDARRVSSKDIDTSRPEKWYDIAGIPHVNIPKGHYVYGWYQEFSPLPFYVGEGCWDRAWQIHLVDRDTKAFCERLRNCNTRIVVYRNNLTKEGAMLLESCLVSLFTMQGARLTNQAEPMTRQEKPPLERFIDK